MAEDFMHTLGAAGKEIIIRKDSKTIAIGIPVATAEAIIPLGVPVSIDSNGDVIEAVATGPHIGLVAVQNEETDGEATIDIGGVAEINAVADGAVTVGQELVKTNTGDYTFATAASGNFVHAIALTGGADTAAIRVAILRSSYQKN